MPSTQAMREELSARYAQMSTEELLDRYQPDTLTEVAAEVMKQELIKRGATLPASGTPHVEPATQETSPIIGDWINITAGLTATDAHILRARLEAEGIPALMGDGHVAQSMWLYNVATSGAKVRIPASYAKQAQEVMQALAQGEYAIDETEESEEKEPPAPSNYTPPKLKIIRPDQDNRHNPYAPPREVRDAGYYEEIDEHGIVRENQSPHDRMQQCYAALAQDKHYARVWQQGVSWLSFSFGAFLFSYLWCFFRKLYWQGFIVLAIDGLTVASSSAFYHYFLAGKIYSRDARAILFLIPVLTIRLILAIIANKIYYLHAKALITRLSQQYPRHDDLLKALHKAGGINFGLVVITIVLQVLISRIL